MMLLLPFPVLLLLLMCCYCAAGHLAAIAVQVIVKKLRSRITIATLLLLLYDAGFSTFDNYCLYIIV